MLAKARQMFSASRCNVEERGFLPASQQKPNPHIG